MQSGTRRLLLATVFVTFGCFAEAQSPPAVGVRVVGAFGAADESGGMVGGVRISAGRAINRVTFAAETEMNLTGEDHGTTYPNSSVEYHDSRRDFVWSGLGGMEIWQRHRTVSFHVVGGVSWVKPTGHPSARILDPAHGWVSAGNLSYSSTWAPTVGAEALFHFGNWSAGPSFRWYGYLSKTSPYASPTQLTAVVLAFGYHF